jgi:hypothetical protein
MKNNSAPHDAATPKDSNTHSRWLWLLMAGCALVILAGISRRSRHDDSAAATIPPNTAEASEAGDVSSIGRAYRLAHSSSSATAQTAEEIVAGKVSQFGRSRRDLARAMGRRAKKDVPPEIEKFFDALEAGRWEEIEAQFKALSKQSGQYEGSSHSPELDPFWQAVLDAYGVAQQAHLWPAQKLLDYGNAILDSLGPGRVCRRH